MFSIALIGCGRIGSLLEEDPLRPKPASHMGGITALAGTVWLAAVCDSDRNKLLQCQKKWHVAKIYLDYKEMISVEQPDIVVIAAWTSEHHAIAVYAAEHGVKGIILEKPISVDLAQAENILRVCRKYNVKLVVNHERRWDPLYIKVRQIIASQELGRLRTIYGNVLCLVGAIGSWQSVLDEVGGGPLLHDGTHLLDMIRCFAGDISWVTGNVTREDNRLGVETTATAAMQSVSGVNIFLEAGGMRDYFNFEIDLQFERGRLVVGNGISKYFVVENSTRYTGFKDLVEKPFPELNYNTEPFTGAIMEVCRAIQENDPYFKIESNGDDARKAMEIIFAVYYSAYLGGKRINLPLNISGHPLKKMFQSGLI